jgi:RNA polymerase sigma-70 factor (ECF subfamily)
MDHLLIMRTATMVLRLTRGLWLALVHRRSRCGTTVRFIRDASRVCQASDLMVSSSARGASMLEQPTEQRREHLHLGLVRGDPTALAEALACHRDRLQRVSRLYCDPRLAKRVAVEDILQELYLAAATRLRHYAEDGFISPYCWLRVVLRQVLIDAHRRHLGALARDARCEVAHAQAGVGASTRAMARELSGSITTPSGAAMRAETHEALIAALEGVLPGDREIIALRHFEDLGNQDISRVLGITEKAASIRYVRALRRLKQQLEQAGLGMSDLHAR